MEDFRKADGSVDCDKFGDYLETQVENLEKALVSASNPPKQPLNANDKTCLISLSYELCDEENHKTTAKWLFDKFGEIFEKRCLNTAYPKIVSKTDSEVLTLMKQEWERHSTMRKWLSSFLVGIETEYCREKGLKLPAQVADEKFKEKVFQPLKGRVGKLMEEEFSKEEEDKNVTWNTLDTCCDLFIKFGTSEEDFELLRHIGRRGSMSGNLVRNAR